MNFAIKCIAVVAVAAVKIESESACPDVSKILTYGNVAGNRKVMTYKELMPFLIKIIDGFTKCGKPLNQ
jgi:hypothetical protein